MNTISLREYKETFNFNHTNLRIRNCMGSRGFSRLLTLKYVV